MKILVAALLSSALGVAQAPAPLPQQPQSPSSGKPVEKPIGTPTEKPVGKPDATPAPKSDEKQPVTPQQPVEAPKDPTKPPANEPNEVPAGQPREGDPAPVLPQGSDPADLAAMRSAEAMLDAERRLAQMIKDGKIAGLDKVVTFDELTAWPYEDGLKGMPKRVKDLNGKKVLMSGFMLPIDEVQNIKEFLLVQSLWSCCYGQPPDINGIVRVVMPKGKTTDYFFDPLKIIGTFKVEATSIDGYCVDIYQIEVESIEALK
ncbi:MAG: DUF3299 domain-containing protein [Planctomycetota bacterium]